MTHPQADRLTEVTTVRRPLTLRKRQDRPGDGTAPGEAVRTAQLRVRCINGDGKAPASG